MTRCDVAVVGAGPSGSIAAYQLARAGLSVLLCDREAFPRWKVCGACMSPGALRVLEAVGLGDLTAALGGVGLGRIVLHASGASAPVSLRGSVALSRTSLDAALVREAESVGAVFWPESRAHLGETERVWRHLRVTRGRYDAAVRARVVVDATGLGRGLRDQATTDRVAPGSRVGLGAVLSASEYPVVAGDLHMAIARGGYVGMVRLEDGMLNVAAALDPRRLREAGPELCVTESLVEAGLPPLSVERGASWRGTPLLTRSSASVGAERLFRVGDAAEYVEPFTGEGICWALGGGVAVARLAKAAVGGWSDHWLDEWRDYRRTSLRASQRLCRAMARALRRPWLVRAAVAAVATAPELASPFVDWAARPPEELCA